MNEQGYEQLTLFPADSRASRSAQPESAEAVKTTVTSGRKCSELSRRSGPLGLLEKMLLESSAWHSTRCYLTWKASATPARRLLFRLVPSMPRTGVTGVQFWHTPTANDAKNSSLPASQAERNQLIGQIIRSMSPTPTTGAGLCGGTGNYQQLKAMEASCQITEEKRRSMAAGNGGQLNPMWVEWLMGFPIGWTDLNASETP